MPVGTYNATKMVELKRERLFEVSTHYVRCTRKNNVFDDFFSQIDQEDHLRKWYGGKNGTSVLPHYP